MKNINYKTAAMLLFGVFVLLYSAFLADITSMSFDSLPYTYEIENNEVIFHPHHLFYHVFALLWYKMLLLFGFGGSSFEKIASLNIFFGAGGISVIFLMLQQNFKLPILRAALYASITGVSFGYWYFTESVEVYIIPLFFVLLALKFFFDEKPVVYVALAAGVAVLFHQVHCLFGLAIIITLFFSDYDRQNKLRNITIFAGAYALIIIIPYAAVLWHLELGSIDDITYWLTLYHHEVNTWVEPHDKSIIKAGIGFFNSLLSPNGFFQIEVVTDWLVQLFPHLNMNDDKYLLRNYSHFTSSIYLSAVIVFGTIYLYLLGGTFLAIKKITIDKKAWLLIIFLIIYSIFFTFWDPTNPEFWIPQATLLWILIAIYRKDRGKYLEWMILAIVFAINFFWAVLPSQDINNDYHFAKVKSTDSIVGKEFVIVEYRWVTGIYFNRYSDLKPLIIKSDRSDTLSKYLDRSIISPNAYALLPDTLSHDLIKISKNDFDWYIRK